MRCMSCIIKYKCRCCLSNLLMIFMHIDMHIKSIFCEVCVALWQYFIMRVMQKCCEDLYMHVTTPNIYNNVDVHVNLHLKKKPIKIKKKIG